jgi:hypothetical protein
VFAIPGICALIIFILARPQEFIETLQRLPMLYVFSALAVGGFIIDLRLRRLQPIAVPTLPWVIGFVLWALLCNAIVVPETFLPRAIELGILVVLYATIAHGVQQFRTFQVVAATLMGTCLFLAIVCFHQGHQPRQCVEVDEVHLGEGVPDGRPCELSDVCHLGPDAEPGAEYRCERVGWFGTYSIEDRVRYRGELHDPNELSMVISIGGLSFLIAFMLRRKTATRILFGTFLAVIVVWTVILSKSRGGMVVALAVPGVYFIKRFGFRGVLVAAAAALPVLALGGRGGEAAAVSTELRYEAWAAGLDMFQREPLFGVGMRQFGEEHFMAAHNSYVLALAELGFVGLVLFAMLIYASIKVVVVGLWRLEHVEGAQIARVWGMALLASLLGMAFQINTLSFSYHSVLWIFLGLAGAWTSAVRHHMPEFNVKIGLRDVAGVVVACAIYTLVVLPIFLRWKHAL